MKAVKNVLASYIKLCYVYLNFKWTNQSCWSSKINQTINVEWRTCDWNVKQFFQWKPEKPCLFDKGRSVLILLDFAKCLSFSEVEKNSNDVNV